jgi:hypothetical protein
VEEVFFAYLDDKYASPAAANAAAYDILSMVEKV